MIQPNSICLNQFHFKCIGAKIVNESSEPSVVQIPLIPLATLTGNPPGLNTTATNMSQLVQDTQADLLPAPPGALLNTTTGQVILKIFSILHFKHLLFFWFLNMSYECLYHLRVKWNISRRPIRKLYLWLLLRFSFCFYMFSFILLHFCPDLRPQQPGGSSRPATGCSCNIRDRSN